MKNKTLTYLALSLLCCICACTSVDLCPEAGHPHITDMRVRLNWGDISKDEIPAEMHIVASRIINTWRTRGIINTSIDPATNNNITQQETSSDTRTASNAKENSEDNSIESPEETAIIRKSKFPPNPERSVQFSGKRTKRSVQKKGCTQHL